MLLETAVSTLYEGNPGKCDKAHKISTHRKLYVCANSYTSRKKLFMENLWLLVKLPVHHSAACPWITSDSPNYMTEHSECSWNQLISAHRNRFSSYHSSAAKNVSIILSNTLPGAIKWTVPSTPQTPCCIEQISFCMSDGINKYLISLRMDENVKELSALSWWEDKSHMMPFAIQKFWKLKIWMAIIGNAVDISKHHIIMIKCLQLSDFWRY